MTEFSKAHNNDPSQESMILVTPYGTGMKPSQTLKALTESFAVCQTGLHGQKL